MALTINTITLSFPLGMGAVNCYLLQTDDGCVLIDTGTPNMRKTLTRELERLGCRPGSLSLIAITHGDLDHIGNAAYLRMAFGSTVAMHAADARMAETGDMFAGRQNGNWVVGAIMPRLIGFRKTDRFSPDVLIEEGDAFARYGLDATALVIPGHSRGSIAIRTAAGDLFCGDLFENTKAPGLTSLIDDRDAALRSAARLRSLGIKVIYPGHGKAFVPEELGE